MSTRVRSTVEVARGEDRVALIRVCNPPVNALSLVTRQELVAAFDSLANDPAVASVLLTGSDGRFLAGADIRELEQPVARPSVRDVTDVIDAFPKPVVAAIEGVALGGGLEVALVCDARVCTEGSRFGLPEVKLGIIPGAGGTQRLPRVLGRARGMELIARGHMIRADEAMASGLVDEVTAEEALVSSARELARARQGGERSRLSAATVAEESREDLDRIAAGILSRARGQPAVHAAIDAVNASVMEIGDGLAVERALFLSLRDGDEAKALRHLFFAERAAAKLDGKQGQPQELRKIGVVGAGTMGSGIAMALADAGFHVVLVDRDESALKSGLDRVEATHRRSVETGRMAADEAAKSRTRIASAQSLRALADSDLVIEAVFEDLGLKQEIFEELGRIVAPGTILATNTSFLDVNAIAEASHRPDKVLGLHFFSPAHLMRLLEIVKGDKSSLDTLATGMQLARRAGKIGVVAGVCDGFIGNRINLAYRQQCEFMLDEGATPWQVDQAMQSFGLAMGPFAAVDQAGLDISWARRRWQAAHRDPRVRYSEIADLLCEAGRSGVKSGAGWHRYADGKRKPEPDPYVEELIDRSARKRGSVRRELEADEIVGRALAAMVNEAGLVLEDGVAQRSSDIDVVMVHGYGFPAVRGGPMFWAAQQQRQWIDRNIGLVEASTGFGFRRAENLKQLFDR